MSLRAIPAARPTHNEPRPRNPSSVFLAAILFLLLSASLAAGVTPTASVDQEIRRATGGQLHAGLYSSVAEWNDGGSDTMPARAPGEGLHERLVRAGGHIGGGSDIILDSRYISSPAGFDPSLFTREAVGHRVITPGVGSFLAWFGTWYDKNDDGVIDVYVDAYGFPDDVLNEWEREWRGNLVAWMWPSNPDVGCQPPGVLVANDCRRENSALRTLGILEMDEARQSPSFHFSEGPHVYRASNGWFTVFVDESVLMSTWMMVVSNPMPMPMSAQVYDYTNLYSNSELRDIDRYASLSPDVESLYVATAWMIRDLEAQIPQEASALKSIVVDALQPVTDSLKTIAPQGYPQGWLIPGYPQGEISEGCSPNLHICPYVALHLETMLVIPQLNAEVSGQGKYSPFSHPGGDRSTLPGYLAGRITAGWWLDVNGDGWVGRACDPTDPQEWDAERGECVDPYDGGRRANPNDYRDSSEFTPGCRVASVGSLLVQPESNWPPGAAVVRDYRAATSHVTATPLLNAMEVSLTVHPLSSEYCGLGGPGETTTLDMIRLPSGSHLGGITASLDVYFPAWMDANTGHVHEPGLVTARVRILPVL